MDNVWPSCGTLVRRPRLPARCKGWRPAAARASTPLPLRTDSAAADCTLGESCNGLGAAQLSRHYTLKSQRKSLSKASTGLLADNGDSGLDGGWAVEPES